MPYVLASLPAGGQAQGKWSGGFEWKTEKLKQYSGLWSIHNTTSSRYLHADPKSRAKHHIKASSHGKVTAEMDGKPGHSKRNGIYCFC